MKLKDAKQRAGNALLEADEFLKEARECLKHGEYMALLELVDSIAMTFESEHEPFATLARHEEDS